MSPVSSSKKLRTKVSAETLGSKTDASPCRFPPLHPRAQPPPNQLVPGDESEPNERVSPSSRDASSPHCRDQADAAAPLGAHWHGVAWGGAAVGWMDSSVAASMTTTTRLGLRRGRLEATRDKEELASMVRCGHQGRLEMPIGFFFS